MRESLACLFIVISLTHSVTGMVHRRERKSQQEQYLQKMNHKQLDTHSESFRASDGKALANPNECANYLIKAKLPE